MADVTKRVTYFDRQFLRAKEFQDEQAYHLNRRRLHNRAFHSPGVTNLPDGLKVDKKAGTNNQVTVQPGLAVDEDGQEIILPEPGRDLTITRSGAGAVGIFISYPNPELPADPSSDPGIAGTPTRIDEQAVLTRVPGDADTAPPKSLPLATVTVNAGGNITGTIQDRRAAAGVGSANILDASISSVKLQDNAVTGGKIQDNAVTAAKLQDNAITAAKIQDNAVTEQKLHDDAVTSAKIKNGTVLLTKLNATDGIKPPTTTNPLKIEAAQVKSVEFDDPDTFRLINVEIVSASPANAVERLQWAYVIRRDIPTPKAVVFVRLLNPTNLDVVEFRVRSFEFAKA